MSPSSRRVLALIDTKQISGPGRQLAAVVGALEALDVQVRVVLFRRMGEQVRPYESFLSDLSVDSVVVTERSAFDFALIEQLDRLTTDFRPHVIQTHGYKPSAVAWGLRARGRQTPWLAFFHGATTENLKVRAYHWLDQRLMRRADIVVAMSNLHLQSMRPRMRDVRLVHNAVLFPPVTDASTGLPADKPRRLLVVSRLSSEKGIDVLLDAASQLRDEGVDFELTVLGDGPDRDALSRSTADLELGDRVRFVGHHSDPRPFYRASDLLVIPSRSEGLPNVLLEGIAHGLPIVSTAVGAVPEVLDDPQVGLLVQPNDKVALASAIRAALNPEYRASGALGRARVLDAFSLSRRAATLASLYAELSDA